MKLVNGRGAWRTAAAATIVAGLGAACVTPSQIIEGVRLACELTKRCDGLLPDEAETASAQRVRQVDLAYQLAAEGERTRSPLPMITAAQLLLNHPTRALTAQPQQSGGTGDGSGARAPDVTAAELLNRAGQLAAGNAALTGVVQALQRQAQDGVRGAEGGPMEGEFTIPGSSTHTFDIVFRGGEMARVFVRGAGRTDLDCRVYGADNQLILQDIQYDDSCQLSWFPQSRGAFRVVVQNLGPASNGYVLLTN